MEVPRSSGIFVCDPAPAPLNSSDISEILIKPVYSDNDTSFVELMGKYKNYVKDLCGGVSDGSVLVIDVMPDMRHYRAAFFAARHCVGKVAGGAYGDGITVRLDGDNPAAVTYYIALTAMGATVTGYAPEDKIRDARAAGEIIITDEQQAYFLSPETTEISPPLLCSPHMEDDICDAADTAAGDDDESPHTPLTAFDVLLIEVDCADDAVDFCSAAAVAELPVMFTSGNEIALKTALMLYQGRALVDKNSAVAADRLAEITAKYGAVLY